MADVQRVSQEEGEWRKNDMFFEYRVKVAPAALSASVSASQPHDVAAQEGAELKNKGNDKFKAGEYSEAAVLYRKGIYYASFDESQFNFELHDPHRVQVQ